MKRQLSTLMLLGGIIFSANYIFAQQAAPSPSPIVVKLLFKPVQSIVLNPKSGTIKTFFNADGWSGLVTVQQEQVTVFSTSTFEIDITAAEHFFYQQEGKQRLAISPMDVDALPQRGNHTYNSTRNSAVTFDVRYRPSGTNRIIVPVQNDGKKKAENKAPTTELIYTVHAK